ncbi:hypothetical protein BH23GEM9_BH23GEM9_11430 [soil metagenome]
MHLILSDRSWAGTGRHLFAGVVMAVAATCAPLAAQQPASLAEVVSSEFSMSRETAILKLELGDGRTLDVAVRDGAAFVDGRRIGDAPRGGELDRSWRELLTRGMDASTGDLAPLLSAWSAPGSVGADMAAALSSALSTDAAEAAPDATVATDVPSSDSVSRLVDRIAELERAVQRAERSSARVVVDGRSRSERRSVGPLHYIGQGVAGVFSTLVTYAVLFAIAFGVIAFGGRKYIEGVGDTARRATTRSLLVGLAASFLIIPVFILGMIALVISIVGIPGLLLWAPGFPVAVVLAVLLGYLGVAHASGEAVAERRFYVNDWFQRGNSYYFLLSGLGVLLAFFIAASIVHMAGPWLRVISGLLTFLGIVTTATACIVGFGAVLISRAGTRPFRPDGETEEQELFTEEAGV